MGAALYGAAARTVDDDAALRFENLARSTQYGISARIKSYSDLTRALAALFQTTDNVTRKQFHQYVTSLDIRALPGDRSADLGAAGPDAQRAVCGQRARRRLSEFRHQAAGPARAVRGADLSGTGGDAGRALGVDIAANPLVAKMLASSRDSGQVAASGQPIVASNRRRTSAWACGCRSIAAICRWARWPSGARPIWARWAGFSIPRLVQGAIDEMTVRQVHLTLYADGSAMSSSAGW
jgi:hypothetical protein